MVDNNRFIKRRKRSYKEGRERERGIPSIERNVAYEETRRNRRTAIAGTTMAIHVSRIVVAFGARRRTWGIAPGARRRTWGITLSA